MEKLLKTLTLTYSNSDNFGSVLQAYALQKVIESFKYENEIIDYIKEEVSEMYQPIKPVHSRFDFLSNIYNCVHLKKLYLRKQRYELFRKEMLRMTHVKYTSFDDLRSNPPVADCYICGSDQVWNTGIKDFDESYLLRFVKKGRKVSYAASGINERTTEEEIKRIARQVCSFDAISVRENIAKERLFEVAGIKSECALDPVLLLDRNEWNQLTCDYSQENPYMLCYFAGGVSKEFEKYTYSLAKKLGLKRILLMPEWRNIFRVGEKRYDSGPIEFLSLVKYASFVCTNSFHGTAFSIIFNKPFQVELIGSFTDSRITTLLDLCELTDWETNFLSANVTKLYDKMDYCRANQKLEIEKKRCREWIRQVLIGKE